MNFRLVKLLCLSSLITVSCATSQNTTPSIAIGGDTSNVPAIVEEGPQEAEIKDSDIVSSEEYGSIKLVINRPVMTWISYFKGRGRKHMRRYLERSSKYFPMMKKVLREQGLPESLVYVPLIESGLSSSAHSFASAVGYWQFIRSTGKRYGLKINSYVDERRDPVLSTRAAAQYFKALYNLFGDWYLALAAYNTGENRVKRAVMRYGTRNFWKLAKRRRLHKETRNYVPKFLAAMIIAKNPARYGFEGIQYQEKLNYDTVKVFKSISLAKLAKNMGLDYKLLKGFNPKFRSDYVNVTPGGSTDIRVPKGLGRQAIAKIDSSYSVAPKIIPNDYYWYRVRRGDTLSHIAMRNRTGVSTIRRLNRLGRRSFIRVGQRLKVPDRGTRSLRARYRRKGRSRKVDLGSGEFHTVRRGENLSLIARKYGVSVSKLKRLNRLGRRSLIKAGQKIKIKEKKPSKTSRIKGSSRSNYHIVKSGENLTLIARKYGASIGKIRAWNGLGRRSVLRPGQKLRVKRSTFKKIHTVRRGENLSVIANKYRVSVASIARANNLRSRSKIYVGKKLSIPSRKR